MPYIYLLQTHASFKIGKTKSLSQRMAHYHTHNPDIQRKSYVKVSNHHKIETHLLDMLRQFYKSVPGTKEWFTGSLPESLFQEYVNTLVEEDEQTVPDVKDVLWKEVSQHFSEQNTSLEYLLSDYLEGGLAWKDFEENPFILYLFDKILNSQQE